MTATSITLAGFADVRDFNSLIQFFQARGITFDKSTGLLRITPQHFMRLELVDEFTPDSIESKRKQLLDMKNVRYGLLVGKDYSKFKFIRHTERPNTFTYDSKKKHSFERLQSIYKLLDSIAYSNEPFNESILALFEVKTLVDRFYKEYTIVRDKLARQIRGTKNGVNGLYAQVILDRFIFIYFLQAKRILPQDYLAALYERALENKKDYYEDYLQPLFFRLLNSDDVAVKAKHKDEFGAVPYLNGGLFRPRDFEVDGIRIANEAWKSVFDLFNGYEWVIEDIESGGLTPEILGHIFEMSMNEWERKVSASYYTPKEVTRLMCEHAISSYILGRFAERYAKEYSSLEEAITMASVEELEFLFTTARQLRLVDPAAGSGAFLVAAEEILVHLLLTLHAKLRHLRPAAVKDLDQMDDSDNTRDYYFRKMVVTQNLYGVDINPEATEICKLRLWLSMVTAATTTEPLPNIEFNIRTGNSLLGFTNLGSDTGTTLRLDDPQTIRQKLEERSLLVSKYKETADSNIAQSLSSQINLVTKKFKEDLDKKLFTVLQLAGFSEKLFDEPVVSTPFHWVMEFPDIFGEGGFDIVVTNPPFTRSERLRVLNNILPHVMRDKERYFRKAMGLHCYFIFQASELLRPKGVFAAVLPAATFGTDYGQGTKEFLLDRFRIMDILSSYANTTFSDGCTFKEILLTAIRESVDSWSAKIVVLNHRLSGDNYRDILGGLLSKSQMDRELAQVTDATREDLQKEWNWMRFTRAEGLRRIHDRVSMSDRISAGEDVFVPQEGVHMNLPYFFFIPNRYWRISNQNSRIIEIQRRDGKMLRIPRRYAFPSLRRPEFHRKITPELTHFLVLIPPEKLDPETAEYVAWGKAEHARHKAKAGKERDWVDTYCKQRGIPWYSYMYDDASSRKSKGRVVLIMKFRLKKRSCIAHFFDDEIRATNMYFLGSTERPDSDKVLVSWFNSTMFLALYLYSRREIAGDWGQVKIVDLNKYPIVDPRKLTESSIRSICAELDKMREMDLPPIPDQLGNSPRRDLDLSIARSIGIPSPERFVDELHHIVREELGLLS